MSLAKGGQGVLFREAQTNQACFRRGWPTQKCLILIDAWISRYVVILCIIAE